MKKQNRLPLLLSSSIVACASVLALTSFGIKAKAAKGDGTCSHVGNHYKYKAATSSESGHKEFYACCHCHEQFLIKPTTGTWTEASEPESITLGHKAYLPKLGAASVTSKTANLYVYNTAQNFGTMDLYEVSTEEGVPYLDQSGLYTMLSLFFGSSNLSASLSGNTMTVTRTDNSTYMTLNFATSQVYFSNYSKFLWTSSEATPMDVLYAGSGFDFLTLDSANTTYYLDSKGVTFDLSKYGIYGLVQSSVYLFPLSTWNDLIFTRLSFNLFSNGTDIFFSNSGPASFTDSAKALYYAATPKNRSVDMASFSYREMCFAFDKDYGLKSERGITSTFDAWCEGNGLKTKLLSVDASIATNAQAEFAFRLGDCHTAFNGNSPYAGKDFENDGLWKLAPDSRYAELSTNYSTYTGRRKALIETNYAYAGYQYGGSVNTAYISFDSFTMNYNSYQGIDDSEILTRLGTGDTIALFAYAAKQVANTSTIKNVVIDLSCNTGGVIGVCAYIQSWINGSATLALKSAVDDCYSQICYKADVNLDGTIDSNDVIRSDVKVYLLTSPVSFSCGNLLPNLGRQNSRTTIIGKRSFGGACPVGALPTADGAFFNTSSSTIMGEIDDGYYTNFESGAAVDYEFTNVDDFYNRAGIVNWINTL